MQSLPLRNSRTLHVSKYPVQPPSHPGRRSHIILLLRGRCDPSSFVEFVSTCVPPTLDCLLGTVLPSLIAQISTWQQQHGAAAATESDAGARKRKDRSSEPQEARPPGSSRNDGRAVEAIQNLCRLGGAFAKAERQDPVRFRNKISASGLRNLGAVGREAEVVLAEAFFARSSGHL